MLLEPTMNLKPNYTQVYLIYTPDIYKPRPLNSAANHGRAAPKGSNPKHMKYIQRCLDFTNKRSLFYVHSSDSTNKYTNHIN